MRNVEEEAQGSWHKRRRWGQIRTDKQGGITTGGSGESQSMQALFTDGYATGQDSTGPGVEGAQRGQEVGVNTCLQANSNATTSIPGGGYRESLD